MSLLRPCRRIPYRVSTRFYLGVHAPQPTTSTWAYTSAASCSVCCTKAGSIQRTSYKRGESSKLYRKGRLYCKERFQPRHAFATLQRREAGYRRGLQQSQLAQYLSHLLQCSLFGMQIIVRETYSSHNWHNVCHAYYSAVYSKCRSSSGRAI